MKENLIQRVELLTLARAQRKYQQIHPHLKQDKIIPQSIRDAILSRLQPKNSLKQDADLIEKVQNELNQTPEWISIAAKVLTLIQQQQDPGSIARSLEMCFLHSGLDTVFYLFPQIQKILRSQALQILHKNLRCQLVSICHQQPQKCPQLWQAWLAVKDTEHNSAEEQVLRFLFQKQDQTHTTLEELTQIDKQLRIFEEKAPTDPFWGWIPQTTGNILYEAAQKSLTYKRQDIALHFLEHITTTDRAYSQACHMYFEILSEAPLESHIGLLTKLRHLDSFVDQKVYLEVEIAQWCDTTTPQTPKHAASIFLPFCFPHLWLQKNAKDWIQFASFLWEHRALADTFPDYWHYFTHPNHAPDVSHHELCAWRTLADKNPETTQQHHLLCKVQTIVWLNVPEYQEDSNLLRIYQQHRIFAKQHTHGAALWRKTWNMIGASLQGNDTTNQHLAVLHRSISSTEKIKVVGLGEYLHQPKCSIPASLLQEIITEAKEHNAYEVEALAREQESSQYLNITNQDLRRHIKLSAWRKKDDGAWIGMSILASRQSMTSTETAILRVSPETKDHTHFQQLSQNAIDLALHDFNNMERRLIWSCLKLNHKLADLAFKTKICPADKIKLFFKQINTNPFFNESIRKFLSTSKWLFSDSKPELKMSLRRIPEIAFPTPHFLSSLPDMEYAYLLAAINYRLSLPFWDSQPTKIAEFAHKCANNAQGSGLSKAQKDAFWHWKSRLSRHEKNLWHDFINSSNTVPQEKIIEIFGSFVARSALLIYPNHLAALQALKSARAPATVIWNLEKFMMSVKYQYHRQTLHLSYPLSFPTLP
ncbi:MAG: hypothetical protein OXT67_07135 [Zetaproteobacteria bacterium]|nr:hypothetical protein [Zetaproteobacteria bacterium]